MRAAHTSPAVRTDLVWAGASLLTIVSWVLAATGHAGRLGGDTPEVVAVLAICGLKVRWVIREFMEVRDAPRWLGRATDGWLIVMLGALLVLYLTAAN
jgi:hypothetical protein